MSRLPSGRTLDQAVQRATDPKMPPYGSDEYSAMCHHDNRLLTALASLELPEDYVEPPYRDPRNGRITEREREVLRLVRFEALSQKEIAMRLGVGHEAVREWTKAARRMLGAHSTAQAALYAEQRGLL